MKIVPLIVLLCITGTTCAQSPAEQRRKADEVQILLKGLGERQRATGTTKADMLEKARQNAVADRQAVKARAYKKNHRSAIVAKKAALRKFGSPTKALLRTFTSAIPGTLPL